MLIRARTENPLLSVGNTPLVELRRLTERFEGRVRIFAKVEGANPGGSVKDRPALRIVREGLASGRFMPGQTLLDATSGNTGIAYAWLGAQLGFKVRLCVPASINEQRKQLLLAYGALLELSSPLDGSDGAIRLARELFKRAPEEFFYADQYNNPDNWKAHFETTGPEIWSQTGGKLTHFVAGLGTSGTFVGTGRRLKAYDAAIKLVSVQPDGPLHGLEGLKHMETALVPGIYDSGLADENTFIFTEEAQDMVRRLAREEGLLAGPSGGANVLAALQLAQRLQEGGDSGLIVTLLPDDGERYLNESFWKEARP